VCGTPIPQLIQTCHAVLHSLKLLTTLFYSAPNEMTT